jgi:hypothetical protein
MSARDFSTGGVFVSAITENDRRLSNVINLAALQTETSPTLGQKASGNYRKGRFNLNGLQFVIENPKGSVRSGVSSTGKRWSVEMPAHYGYVSRTNGADGDQVDVYVGLRPSSGKIYVFDQVFNGVFDEHKVMIGFPTLEEAKDVYSRSFTGSPPYGGSAEMTWAEFKDWLETGDQHREITSQAVEKFTRTVQLMKSHEDHDGDIFLYGAVMVPDLEDRTKFRDILSEDVIRRSARKYLTKSRNTGYRHKAILHGDDAEITQSFIAPADMKIGENEIPRGSWVIECCVKNPELKKQVANGEIAAFSYGASSLRWRIEEVTGDQVRKTRWMGPRGDHK